MWRQGGCTGTGVGPVPSGSFLAGAHVLWVWTDVARCVEADAWACVAMGWWRWWRWWRWWMVVTVWSALRGLGDRAVTRGSCKGTGLLHLRLHT